MSGPTPVQSSRFCLAVFKPVRCDVLVVGGTTAAVAAALAAADHLPDKQIVLLEPTNWPGGQLTASAVSAIDWTHHRLELKDQVHQWDLGPLAALKDNITPLFHAITGPLTTKGVGWVSRTCYQPRRMVDALMGLIKSKANLKLFLSTVPKAVLASGGRIKKVVAIQRKPKDNEGYDRLPSDDIPDWYLEGESDHYEIREMDCEPREGGSMVVIDATEWGEILALADARYAIGTEMVESNPDSCDETMGQAIVFDFVQKITEGAAKDPEAKPPTAESQKFYSHVPDYYRDPRHPEHAEEAFKPGQIYDNIERALEHATPARDSSRDAVFWHAVFLYRRIKGRAPVATTGDLSVQNWNPGNDYPFGYLFKNKAATKAELGDWKGGVDYKVMAGAETHAFGWHEYLKQRAPADLAGRVVLAPSILGTKHGLAKVPYIRDTRRSVGIDGFTLQSKWIHAAKPERDPIAERPHDAIALACYALDFHTLAGRTPPGYLNPPKRGDVQFVLEPPGAFYIPYRSLTNETYENLLVAGKTMAQSYFVNAATRLHPTEFASGTAAGVAAAFMILKNASSRDLYQKHLTKLQETSAPATPNTWTLKVPDTKRQNGDADSEGVPLQIGKKDRASDPHYWP